MDFVEIDKLFHFQGSIIILEDVRRKEGQFCALSQSTQKRE